LYGSPNLVGSVRVYYQGNEQTFLTIVKWLTAMRNDVIAPPHPQMPLNYTPPNAI
jgi:hypothetical protein